MAIIYGFVQWTTQEISGPWSEAQRVWIETGSPKITIKTNSNTTWAQTGSVTVALQDSKSGLAAGASVKYGWSTSLDTAPDSYTDATLNYTAGTKDEVTFTASASGLTGKYYLWVVPTTLADTAGNTQTATAKSTGQFYFDNKGPGAPTITGGNSSSSWATSATIKVSTAAIDANVGTVSYYQYYCGSAAPTANTGATASLASGTTSVTFNTNYNGYYVSFRGVDSLGNVGEWSGTNRLYIDTVSPTVTAKNSSLSITKGASNTFASLFTVTWGGITTGTTAYTLNNASTSYTNTSQLAAGTHTLKCTVTKNNGKTASANMTLIVNALPSTDTLLVTVAGNSKWVTVPNDVKVLKIVISGGWGGSGGGILCYDRGENETITWDGEGTYYVKVNPGWYMRVSSGKDSDEYYDTMKVYYSSEINKVTSVDNHWTDTDGTCFVAGTKVSTPSGFKNIEDIQIGDIVYSMNLETMQLEEKAVEKLKITENVCKLTYLIFIGENYIEATADHKFYVKNKGWVDACDLEVGDILINEQGNEQVISDIKAKNYNEPITVYNFEVQDNRNYFVGENKILVYTIPQRVN